MWCRARRTFPYYINIVREKHILRKMIHTCTDVLGRVYEHEGEVDALLDEVERDVLRISEERVEANEHRDQGDRSQGDQSHRGVSPEPGNAHGACPQAFLDLDRMTSGLHGGRNDRDRGAAIDGKDRRSAMNMPEARRDSSRSCRWACSRWK
jgi:replicative DNA helicase